MIQRAGGLSSRPRWRTTSLLLVFLLWGSVLPSTSAALNECWATGDGNSFGELFCKLSLTDTWDVTIPGTPFGTITCVTQILQMIDLAPFPGSSSSTSASSTCSAI